MISRRRYDNLCDNNIKKVKDALSSIFFWFEKVDIGHWTENRRVPIDSFCYGIRSYCWQTKGHPFLASFRWSPEAFDNFFENLKVHPKGAALQIPNAYRGSNLSPFLYRSLLSHSTLLGISKFNEMETILTRESNWRALYRDDIASHCGWFPLTSAFINFAKYLLSRNYIAEKNSFFRYFDKMYF